MSMAMEVMAMGEMRLDGGMMKAPGFGWVFPRRSTKPGKMAVAEAGAGIKAAAGRGIVKAASWSSFEICDTDIDEDWNFVVAEASAANKAAAGSCIVEAASWSDLETYTDNEDCSFAVVEAGAGNKLEAGAGNKLEAGAGNKAEAGAGNKAEAGAGNKAEAGAGNKAAAEEEGKAKPAGAVKKKERYLVKDGYIKVLLARPPRDPLPPFSEELLAHLTPEFQESFRTSWNETRAVFNVRIMKDKDILKQYHEMGYAFEEIEVEDGDERA